MTPELKLPLAYRPHQYDDWGVLRDADGNLFTQISWPRFGEEVYAEHRKNGTDPYEQAAKMVMNAVNARPPQDAALIAFTPFVQDGRLFGRTKEGHVFEIGVPDGYSLSRTGVEQTSPGYFLDTERLNELQIETIDKILSLTKHGAKSIDVEIRKDGKEYRFQADWIKHLKFTPQLRSQEITGGAIADIAAERKRQIEKEGWSIEHDDDHDDGSLAKAAGCYALHAGGVKDIVGKLEDHGTGVRGRTLEKIPRHWPWSAAWWKPKRNPRKDLVRAGALIVAEIERLDRATPQPAASEGECTLCDKGFPVDKQGFHYPTQKYGMIESEPCPLYNPPAPGAVQELVEALKLAKEAMHPLHKHHTEIDAAIAKHSKPGER
jgi:hypothetical protein